MSLSVEQVGSLTRELRKDLLRIEQGRIIKALEEEMSEQYDFSDYNLNAYRKGIQFAIDTVKGGRWSE